MSPQRQGHQRDDGPSGPSCGTRCGFGWLSGADKPSGVRHPAAALGADVIGGALAFVSSQTIAFSDRRGMAD